MHKSGLVSILLIQDVVELTPKANHDLPRRHLQGNLRLCNHLTGSGSWTSLSPSSSSASTDLSSNSIRVNPAHIDPIRVPNHLKQELIGYLVKSIVLV